MLVTRRPGRGNDVDHGLTQPGRWPQTLLPREILPRGRDAEATFAPPPFESLQGKGS